MEQHLDKIIKKWNRNADLLIDGEDMDNEESSVNRVLVQFKEKDDNILIEHKLELSEDEYNEFMDNEEKMLKSAKRYKQNKEDRYLDFLIPAAIIIVSVAIADMMSGFRLHEWLAALIG